MEITLEHPFFPHDALHCHFLRRLVRILDAKISIFTAVIGTIYLMEAEHALMGSRVSKTALRTALSQTSECLQVLFHAFLVVARHLHAILVSAGKFNIMAVLS